VRIDIVSLFPEMFDGVLGCSIIARATAAGLAKISVVNPGICNGSASYRR
jgi:tRNA G37 N-methylase TrmD